MSLYTQYYYSNAVSIDTNATTRMRVFFGILQRALIKKSDLGENVTLGSLLGEHVLEDMAKMSAAIPVVVGSAGENVAKMSAAIPVVVESVGEKELLNFKVSLGSLDDLSRREVGDKFTFFLPRHRGELYLGVIALSISYVDRAVSSMSLGGYEKFREFRIDFDEAIKSTVFNDGREKTLREILSRLSGIC